MEDSEIDDPMPIQDVGIQNEEDERVRQICVLPNGRWTIKRPKNTMGAGLVHMLYISCAMEWVNLKLVIKDWLVNEGTTYKIDDVDQITIGWKHLPSISSMIYMPKKVFCDFLVEEFEEQRNVCGYAHKRQKPYLNQDTIILGIIDDTAHVRMTDLNCIHDKNLKSLMSCGLNHIPLQHTNLAEVVDELLRAWSMIVEILDLDNQEHQNGIGWLRATFQHILKQATKKMLVGINIFHMAASMQKLWMNLNTPRTSFIVLGLIRPAITLPSYAFNTLDL